MKHYWLIIVISIATAVGLNNVLLLVDIAQYSKAYQETVDILYSPPFWKQILYTGILVPVIEELIFRGLIFKLVRKWLPFVVAMIVSAILFGLYHGNLVQFVYASICGLLLAYLYEVFGSIVATILGHMCMNVTACVMTEYGMFNWMFENVVRVWVVTVGCIVIFSVAFIYLQKLDVTKLLKKYCKHSDDVI